MKKILSLIFLIGLSLIIPAKTSALTDLNPGELFIISVNSDTTYPSGTNSNAFDFVTTVDLDPNTVIYFTDIAWTGTGWKNPIGEGLLRYTAPVAGPVDDYFRIKTKVGVMFLQIKLNELLEGQITPLVVDGIVGPFTKKAINHSC